MTGGTYDFKKINYVPADGIIPCCARNCVVTERGSKSQSHCQRPIHARARDSSERSLLRCSGGVGEPYKWLVELCGKSNRVERASRFRNRRVISYYRKARVSDRSSIESRI